jgi:hypothetical protein
MSSGSVIRSITQVGTHEPFELQVSRGQIPGHKRLLKFGFNALINEIEETVWEAGGIYVYPSSAVALTATSSSGATDSGVILTVQGLDADYNEISETITLNASGVATTTKTFLRANRAFVAGSKALTGAVSFANGGVTYAYVNSDNQTLMALWTVPAGYTAYIVQTDVTVMTEANNKFGTVRLVTRAPGGVFRTQDLFSAQNTSIVREFVLPLPVAEKTDIEFRAVGSSANALLNVAATFELVYIKNQGSL